jgi:hypothetical protein
MKLLLFRRKVITVIVCALIVCGMFYAVNYPAIAGAAAASRQLPIYCVRRDYKVAALSFDAAWGNEDTELLIDILAKYNVKATFFVVGQWVDKYPESVKALSDAGHEVMNHSSDHAHFNSLSTDQIIADITACNEKIKAITGVSPTLFRPPYGEYDDHVISAVRSMGMEPIQWDVETLETGSSCCAARDCGSRARAGPDELPVPSASLAVWTRKMSAEAPISWLSK